MKRFIVRAFWICSILVVLGLSVRLFWQASKLEVGLESLQFQWRDATWGLLFGRRVPIASKKPIDQARLLQAEIEDVLSRHPDDAELAMAAAFLIDEPSPGFEGSYLNPLESVYGDVISSREEERRRQAIMAFEDACHEQCNALAKKATDLEPDNVKWWRIRAILLWRPPTYFGQHELRDENWLEVLKEASEHDPENSLYDYLAADYYFANSAELELDRGAEIYRVKVNDQENFRRALRCVQDGLQKPIFGIGDSAFTAVAEFLADSTIPLTDHGAIVNYRCIFLRQSLLTRGIWEWQRARSQEALSYGDVRSSLSIQFDSVRLVEQASAFGGSEEYDTILIWIETSTMESLSELVRDHKSELTTDEIERITTLDEQARLKRRVVNEVNITIAKENQQQSQNSKRMPFVSTAQSMIEELSPRIIFVALIVGLITTCTCRFLKSNAAPQLGIVGHSLSLISALAITVVLFGLAPAKIISPNVQAWSLTAFVFALPLLLAATITWYWLRRRAFQFGFRSMMYCVLAFSMLFALLALASPTAASLLQLPLDLTIPAIGRQGVSGKLLESVIRPESVWLWASLQWCSYQAQFLTLAIWALITASLLGIKFRLRRSSHAHESLGIRQFSGSWARSFGKANFVLLVVLAISYLAVAPAELRITENEFQNELVFARNPAAYWEDMESKIQDVYQDQTLITKLKDIVEREVAADQQRVSESEN